MSDASHAALLRVLTPAIAAVSTVADCLAYDAPSGFDWRSFLVRLQ
jgi:hypothetical protein